MPNPPLPQLVTADQLAGRLTVATPTGTLLATWNDALSDASDALRDTIGQPLTPATSTVPVKVNQYGFGLIPLNPVVAVSAVVDRNGVSLPTDGTGFEVDGQRLTIYPRWMTANPWAHVDPVYEVTVAHGWDPVPGEILRWVYVLAAAQIANAAVGNLGINGGATSVMIDDGKVTYADLSGMIPPRVQARLAAMYGGEQQ